MLRLALISSWVFVLCGCGAPRLAPADGGTPPTATDGGISIDAGSPDSGVPDAGEGADAGAPDAGAPDAGLSVITNHDAVNPACPLDDATITTFSMPVKMDTNTLTHVTVTVRNDGATTWSEADEYRLGSPGNMDPFVENARAVLPNGVRLEGNSVSPPSWTFTFDLRAPAQPGTYETKWQMVKEHVCWFGDVLTIPIVVDSPRATGRCENPAPHGLDQMSAVVHNRGPTRITLDSTPKVCDRTYCAEIGFTDGRTCCPPRPEGHPDVDPCNEAIVGRARDTGRVGPTWTFDGQLCAPMGPGNCTVHPDNQFLLWVYGPGRARACGNLNGVCGEVVVQ